MTPKHVRRKRQITAIQRQRGLAPPFVALRVLPYFHSACCSSGSSTTPSVCAAFLPIVPGDASAAVPQLPVAAFRMFHSIAPSRALRLGDVLAATAPV